MHVFFYAGDCKEWFRERLWCFLFENLSRAVDELYFLCDVEGASEKMNEAILFLEEACQDFKELKACIGVSLIDDNKNDTCISVRKSETEASNSNFEIKVNDKKIDILKVDKKKTNVQNDEESFENLPKVKIIELQTIEENLIPKISSNFFEIQGNEKQLADLVLEEEIDNSTSERNKDESKITTTEKKSEIRINEEILETTFIINNNEKHHTVEINEENFKTASNEKKSEIEINEVQSQTKANEKEIEILLDTEKIGTTIESNISTTSNNFISIVEDKNKKYFQSLSWEVNFNKFIIHLIDVYYVFIEFLKEYFYFLNKLLNSFLY